MCASANDRIAVIQLLIDAKASLENSDAEGKTALTYATLSGSVAGVKLLLDAKADPNSPNASFTPLFSASAQGFPDIVKLLLEARASVQVWAVHSQYLTPAWIAANNRHRDVVRLLQDAGAAPTHHDLMLMYESCAKGHVNDVRRLIDEGFPPIVSRNTFTPLQLAAKYGHTGIVEMFIAARSDVDIKPWNGMTPLHYAVINRDAKRTLLQVRW